MKKILYTLNAYPEGVEVESWFGRVSQPRFQRYSSFYGGDYKHIDIRPSQNPAHYHKLDVFRDFLASDYDRGMFMDMDLYIEQVCPDLWEYYGYGTSMVFDYMMDTNGNYKSWCEQTFGVQPSRYYNGESKHNWETNPFNYYNTGLIVFDRDFAQLMVDRVTMVQSTENGLHWPDGWGEQHYFNFVMDQVGYEVTELPRKANELTGLSQSKGEWISHYAAPWGRSKLSQREIHGDQASFQRKYLKGDIINIGCNEDWAKLKQDFGAYNIDVHDTDPTTGVRNEHDELADARDLPEHLHNRFDTAVLGEILEHFNKGDRVKALTEAAKAIRIDGWINMTFPYDLRPLPDQRRMDSTNVEYTPGVSAFHEEPLPATAVLEDLEDCGLKPLRIEQIHYPFDEVKGTGILACRNDNPNCVCSPESNTICHTCSVASPATSAICRAAR